MSVTAARGETAPSRRCWVAERRAGVYRSSRELKRPSRVLIAGGRGGGAEQGRYSSPSASCVIAVAYVVGANAPFQSAGSRTHGASAACHEAASLAGAGAGRGRSIMRFLYKKVCYLL